MTILRVPAHVADPRMVNLLTTKFPETDVHLPIKAVLVGVHYWRPGGL